MPASLEDRLLNLEKELAALKRLIASMSENGWRHTFGMFSDDPKFDEILRSGREIRALERDDPAG